MATFVPFKKNTAAILFVSLVSQANTKLFQVNPTLAVGDVQVSIDGAAFANLATLPVVTPAAGRAIKVDLSAAEMNGDNIVVQFVDAAGAQWCDLVLNLQTAANQIDDLAARLPAALIAGRMDASVGAMAASVLTAAAIAADAITDAKVAADVTIASVTGSVGSVTGLTAATVHSDLDDIQARLPAALVAGRIDASVGAMAAGVVTAAAVATDAIDADALAADAVNEIADGLLNRDMAVGTDTIARSPRNALRFLRNKRATAAGTLTVTKEDDLTAAWTAALTTDAAAVPVVAVDPA